MRVAALTVALAGLLVGCTARASTTDNAGAGGGDCPVTIPSTLGLRAPEPWPASYPDPDSVWYGTDELWTVLDRDGNQGYRKSVWWSVNFPGGGVEEQPEVWVTWRRLGEGEPSLITNQGEATNAHTSREGWFMIAGIDQSEGCWEVTATYKGATLSYVFGAGS